jgi:transcriptional regulator with XRE-family HTH domain
MITAKRIREHRIRRLLSQAELARRAGVTTVTLSHLENGQQQPRFVTLHRLAKALRVSPQDLVDRPAADAGADAAPVVTSAA